MKGKKNKADNGYKQRTQEDCKDKPILKLWLTHKAL